MDNADGIGAALPALCCPACGHDPPARVILGGRLSASEVAQSPTDILSGPFAGSSRPVEVHARRLRNCGRRPTFFCRPDPARAVLEPPTTRHVRLPADSRAIRGRRKSVRGREQKPPRQRLIGHPAPRSTPLGTGPPHRSRIRHPPASLSPRRRAASTQRSGRRNDTGGGRDPRRHPRSPPRRRPDPRRAHRPRRSLPSWVRTLAHAGPDLSSGAAWRSASSACIPTSPVSTTAGYHLGPLSRSIRFPGATAPQAPAFGSPPTAGAGNTAGVSNARRRAFAADSRLLSALNGTRPLHSPPHQRR